MLKLTKQIAAEFLSALSVLALVFLSFGHQPVSSANASTNLQAYQISALSFCGDSGPADGHTSHAPCHACRISFADLPPAPCEAEPAFASFVRLNINPTDDAHPLAISSNPYLSRAPPIIL